MANISLYKKTGLNPEAVVWSLHTETIRVIDTEIWQNLYPQCIKHINEIFLLLHL